VVNQKWVESHAAEGLAIVMFTILCLYMIWETLRAKKEVE
jgi:hypothetical protein